jgi:riboflavin kinase/FMN adenylyltransferase
LSADEFFRQIIVQQLGARAIVEGPNFFFGRDRQGDIGRLARLCTEAHVALDIVEPVQVEGELVSSSRVRAALQGGAVDVARQMLTRPYRVRGMVTHGAARGAKLGFPTANLEAIDTLLPANGVYAGRAHCQAGTWPAAVNIGPNPTFGESAQKIEAHLIGFAGSLYGQALELEFLSRLRSIQPFDSVAALKAQLVQDVSAAEKIAIRGGEVERE